MKINSDCGERESTFHCDAHVQTSWYVCLSMRAVHFKVCVFAVYSFFVLFIIDVASFFCFFLRYWLLFQLHFNLINFQMSSLFIWFFSTFFSFLSHAWVITLVFIYYHSFVSTCMLIVLIYTQSYILLAEPYVCFLVVWWSKSIKMIC